MQTNIPHHIRNHHAEVVASIVCYSACSISLIILNKLVIATYKINYPMGLLFLQNACAFILVALCKASGLIHYPAFDWRVVKKWLPLTVLFVMMLYTSMKSLELMSVAVQTILKNLAMVLTALGDFYFFEKKLSGGMFGSFVMMALGSYIGSAGDPWVTPLGLFWTFANIFFTVAYVLYMKVLLGAVSKEIGRYGPVYYNNLLSLPFLLPASLTSLPDLMSEIAAAPMGAIVCLVLMVVAGSVMTFATFWCMRVSSPTTYSVTGALNKIPLALLGIVIFSHVPTATGWVGISIALSGGLVYTYLNLPKAAPVAVAAADDADDGREKAQ